ncbi:MAG: hypothetical protein HZB86_06330 [Deltaproteobacteria bacterium]|nr:hypothetical protein [Deltaproteobacteria bacterium]
MNGPLLVSLLPPGRSLESASAAAGSPLAVAVLLLAGLLLSLLLRRP